jgi:hypothetical protein
MTRFDVTTTDGVQVERRRSVDAAERNRLVDFAWRHALRVIVRPADPRPERKAYR